MNIVRIASAKDPSGYALYAVVDGDECLVQNFIDGLEAKYKTQIFNLLEQIISSGLPFNEEKFRGIGDKIFELKTKSGIRILCFMAHANFKKTLILTHGFKKGRPKKLNREKQKAITWYEEYLKGEINIAED